MSENPGTAAPALVEIYTTAVSPYCVAAKALLRSRGAEFDEIPVDEDNENLADMMARTGGATEVPQIFIDGQHLGGIDQLVALHRAGKLDETLGLDNPPDAPPEPND